MAGEKKSNLERLPLLRKLGPDPLVTHNLLHLLDAGVGGDGVVVWHLVIRL